MFPPLNVATLAQYSHLINKSAATLLSAPIKGYSGGCPFLRGLSSVSSYTQHQAEPEQAAAHSKAAHLFSAPHSCPSSGDHSSNNHQVNHQQQVVQAQALSAHQVQAGHQQQVVPHQAKQHDERASILHQQQQQQELNNNQTQNHHQSPGATNGQQTESAQSARQAEAAERPEADLFDYNGKFSELIERKKDDGSYRVFRRVRRFSSSFPHGFEQERPVTIWCSNDYFGMSSHPKVREAILKALNEYGAGSGGTRNIAGNSPVHEQLEWELADLHQKEAALLFSSCYVANDSTLYTLLKLIPDCVVLSDAGNHASMIQGIRNSAAKRHIFKAFDAEDLEAKLKLEPRSRPKIVAFETVHSMTGDVSEVGRMCDIAHRYGALTFVDEVHAVGLYGERGAGIAQRDACMHKIDIVSGTLGKAYGNCGGYIAAKAEIVDVVRSYAAGFIFTTSLPPTVACGATESVRILKGDEGRYLRQLQQNNVFHMKRALTAAGLPHYHSKSHIIPIPVGDAAKCTQVMNDLLARGHYIQSINYPTVPRGAERLRASVTPFHTESMIDSLIERLVAVWQQNNLDFLPPVEVPSNQCRRHQLLQGTRDTQVGQSLWCYLCHKEMNLCTKKATQENTLAV